MVTKIGKLFLFCCSSSVIGFVYLTMYHQEHITRIRIESLNETEEEIPVEETIKTTENSTIPNSDQLNQTRILCFALTTPQNHDTRAIHVKETWGKRCDVFYFVSTEANDSLPSLAYAATNESRDILWGKTKFGFDHAFEHYYDQADWFFKADDDTYVIVENLRYMLKDQDPNKAQWFGCKYSPYVKDGYMSGGAGYVLSKAALKRFVTLGLTDQTDKVCRKDEQGAEDVEMGKCMQNLNVTAADSRDSDGRPRFFALVPNDVIPDGSKDPEFWYWKNQFYPAEDGQNCCSNTTIAFHYMSPKDMYVMDFLIYKLKVFSKDF